MICKYLDIYKNGTLLDNLYSVHVCDELIVSVREDKHIGYIFDKWVDENNIELNPYPEEIYGYENRTFKFNISKCGSVIRANFIKISNEE